MTYIEAVPDMYTRLISITYIEAVPELEAGVNTGLCYRGDQAACVPWVPSIFALPIVPLLLGETIFGTFLSHYGTQPVLPCTCFLSVRQIILLWCGIIWITESKKRPKKIQ